MLLGTAAPWMVEANHQHAQTIAQQTESQQAKQRIDQGCQRLNTFDGKEVLLSPELKAFDPATRLVLAPGTRVCDRVGNTAIIGTDGSLTQFKWATKDAPTPSTAPTATPSPTTTAPLQGSLV